MSDNPLEQEIAQLQTQLNQLAIPIDLKSKIDHMLMRLSRAATLGGYSEEYEKVAHYIHWIQKIPWSQHSADNLDIVHARQVFDAHHHGLADLKERLLEYLAMLKLNFDQNPNRLSRAPILLLVGLVGTGKTTFAKSISEALGRQFIRLPFGGMGSARDLRGQSRLHIEAEPGAMIKALVQAGTNNPVVLLDEVDRVSEQARADIMGVLVELLDPEQNSAFIDHYLDYPVDLSQVLFVATANNTKNIATAVLDRMEPLSMPSYTDDEKIAIAHQYLLPAIMEESGLPNQALIIDESLWPQIVRPLGYDSGIRTLQRTVKGIVRKAVKKHVEGEAQIHLTQENLKEFLPSYKTELI